MPQRMNSKHRSSMPCHACQPIPPVLMRGITQPPMHMHTPLLPLIRTRLHALRACKQLRCPSTGTLHCNRQPLKPPPTNPCNPSFKLAYSHDAANYSTLNALASRGLLAAARGRPRRLAPAGRLAPPAASAPDQIRSDPRSDNRTRSRPEALLALRQELLDVEGVDLCGHYEVRLGQATWGGGAEARARAFELEGRGS